jgi:surface protein
MRQINEYIISKSTKIYTIKADDDNIRQIVKDELDRLGNEADLNHIDVSKVTNMTGLFSAKKINNLCLLYDYPKLNPNISSWNVSNVKNMRDMFYHCECFNCNISEWDVSNVEDMRYMFYYCECFNCNISKWDVSNVIDMYGMFYGCKKFYQNLHNWNAENVQSYSYMFSDRMINKKKYWPKAFPWE